MRHRLMGIDPRALEAAMQERQERHRAVLDQLRARLGATEGRLSDLRARKGGLSASLGRLDAESQQLLEELNRLGEASDRPRQALLKRQQRAEEELQEALALLELERNRWVDLERRIAEGVMAALQPFLDLQLYAEPAETQPGGGAPHG